MRPCGWRDRACQTAGVSVTWMGNLTECFQTSEKARARRRTMENRSGMRISLPVARQVAAGNTHVRFRRLLARKQSVGKPPQIAKDSLAERRHSHVVAHNRTVRSRPRSCLTAARPGSTQNLACSRSSEGDGSGCGAGHRAEGDRRQQAVARQIAVAFRA